MHLTKNLFKISHNERPDTVAFDVEAALVECPLKIFTSIPANVTLLLPIQKLLKRLPPHMALWFQARAGFGYCFLHSEEGNIYLSRAVTTRKSLSSE